MIYLLEDDESIRKFVIYALKSSGFEAEGFSKPSLFYEAVNRNIPRLVLLDIMLPQEDGLTVLSKLKAREDTRSIPVIMLTAKGSEYDKVVGLDSGADDYVIKPFSTMELISRIKAVLRRTETGKKKEYVIGGLYLCPEKHVIKVRGRDVELTLKEFELLKSLVEGAGSVFSREQLLVSIWGYEYDGENRTVDVHINSLRQKLGKCGEIIKTVRGMGYKVSSGE